MESIRKERRQRCAKHSDMLTIGPCPKCQLEEMGNQLEIQKKLYRDIIGNPGDCQVILATSYEYQELLGFFAESLGLFRCHWDSEWQIARRTGNKAMGWAILSKGKLSIKMNVTDWSKLGHNGLKIVLPNKDITQRIAEALIKMENAWNSEIHQAFEKGRSALLALAHGEISCMEFEAEKP